MSEPATAHAGAALAAVLLAGLPLALVLSVLVLRRFRRAVIRAMHTPSTASARTRVVTSPVAPPATPPPSSPVVPRIAFVDARTRGARAARGSVAPWRAGSAWRLFVAPWRLAAAYAAAGLAHAAIAAAVLLNVYGSEFVPAAYLAVLLVFAWPVLPTVATVAVARCGVRWLAGFGGGIVVLGAVALWQPGVLVLWAGFVGVPMLAALALASRPVRAAAPLMLAGVLAALAGAQLLLDAFGLLLAWRGAALTATWIYVTAVLGLIGTAVLVWLALGRLARRYEQKRTSDDHQQLATWWLLFTLWQCVFGITAAGARGALFLLAFLGYRSVLAAGLALVRRRARAARPRELLLLRAFGSRRRSERMLEELGRFWRHHGPIALIAGPDLARAAAQPHEVLAFLRGRLERRFIHDERTLERRLDALDRAPDPDGRYRINAFYCTDPIWQRAVERLFEDADVVLMDARGLSPTTPGLRHEVATVVARVPLEKVLVVVDETTDDTRLRDAAERGWRARAGAVAVSPNGEAAVAMFRVERGGRAELRRLIAALMDAAAARQKP